MTVDEAARVLFAETRLWRADPSAPEQMKAARRALARAIWTFNANGFSAPREPTTSDFGDVETMAAWQDCFASVTENQGAASTTPNTAVFIASQMRPQDSKDLLEKAPALQVAATSEEFGPFRMVGGGAPYVLYVFDAVNGVGPGLFPPHTVAVEGPARASRFRHGWLAAASFFVCVLAFAAVTYGAYRAGLAASSVAVSPDNLTRRLAETIAETDQRLAAEAIPLAEKVVADAKLIPPDGLPWWSFAQPTTAESGTGATESQAQQPAAAAREAATASELEALARAAGAVAQREATAARGFALVSAGERSEAVRNVGAAVSGAVRQDPVSVQRTVNLAAWWAAGIALLVVLAVLVGWGFWGSLAGVIIDSRNRLSLSRFQLVAWTVLVLSLFAVTSTFLIGATGAAVALPQYPWEIWALLGISVGTAPLSGLILVSKTNQTPDFNAQRSIDGDPSVTNAGLVEIKLGENNWSFLDFFRGEEVTNRDEIDISRFQYFVITVVLMVVFVGLTAHALWDLPAGLDWADWARTKSYPALNETFIALLALSHGGYLAVKAFAKPDLQAPQ